MAKKNLILIGFMGTGKTTVGKILSKRLGYKFIDTDIEIEKQCGMEIKKIFITKGEDYFRYIESKIVDNISNNKRTVISCGGGITQNLENIIKLKKNGIIFCLKADSETIIKRLKHSKDRPLLVDKTQNNIEEFIAKREIIYDCADIYIDTTNNSPFIVANKIINMFKMYCKV